MFINSHLVETNSRTHLQDLRREARAVRIREEVNAKRTRETSSLRRAFDSVIRPFTVLAIARAQPKI